MSSISLNAAVPMDTSSLNSRKRTRTDRIEHENSSPAASQQETERTPAHKKARKDSSSTTSTPSFSACSEVSLNLSLDKLKPPIRTLLAAKSMSDDELDDSEISHSPLPPGFSSSSHQYKVVSKLGAGSFGKVFKVEDEAGKVFALKQTKDTQAASCAAERELANLKLFTSKNAPHTTPLRESFATGGTSRSLNFVTKLATGEPLGKLRKQALSLSQIFMMAKQVLEGLAILHRQGIAHADLSAYNVLFDRKSSHATVIDLGAAHNVDTEDSQTVMYSFSRENRAPEIILGMKLDPSIDLWNLGIHIFELFTGERFMRAADSDANYLCQVADRIGPSAWEFFKANLSASKAATMDFLEVGTRAPQTPWKESVMHAAKNRSCTQEDMKPIMELLERLLAVNPKDRLSATELLKHPVFQSDISFRLTALVPSSIKEKCSFLFTAKNGGSSFEYDAASLDKTCVHLPSSAKSFDVALRWKSGGDVTSVQNMEISLGDEVVFRAFYEGTTPQEIDMDDENSPSRTAGSTSSHQS
jgi:serine/threonine protein kinase